MTNPDLLKAIPTERIIFDNKENTINNWSRVSYNKKVEEYSPEGILKNFIRQ